MATILPESDRDVVYSASDSDYGCDSDFDFVAPPSKRFRGAQDVNVPEFRTRGRSNTYDVDVPK
ncbi:hypothetical protein A2U01_0038647, partial [Trifolium medium]|nr:hypothetical protein [Trifolium medium]